VALNESLQYRYYYFPQPLFDNQFELFYHSPKQVACDWAMGQFAEAILDESQNISAQYSGLHEFEFSRIVQSAIEVLGGRGELAQRMDIVALLIGEVCRQNSNIDHDKLCRLCELLWPYLQLPISLQFISKHRIICIILMNFIKYKYELGEKFGETIFEYFVHILNECCDEWTLLYTMVALENCRTPINIFSHIFFDSNLGLDSEKLAKLNNETITALINKWRNLQQNSGEQLVEPQLQLQAQVFYDKLSKEDSSPTQFSTNRGNRTVLNSADKSRQLKLSRDGLQPRSDRQWQSIRSCHQAKEDIFYFEVILLTGGPMRIGWATKRTELERTRVGEDMYSVAIDGFNRVFSHDRSKNPLSASKRWKAGDVIGCMINAHQKKFSFFLVDRIIEITSGDDLHFSTHPYYAAVSLATHQQVICNFGQHPFKYKLQLERIDYWSFCSYLEENPNVLTHSLSIKNANLSNAIVAIGNISARDISFTSRQIRKRAISPSPSGKLSLNDQR